MKKNQSIFEPMTEEESFLFVELLESNQFLYDVWELTRDIDYVTEYDQLIFRCDPRIQSVVV